MVEEPLMSWTSLIPPPPDLLRRFVATPLRTELLAGAQLVTLATNDPELLECLQDIALGSQVTREGQVSCRLIRDHQSEARPGAMQVVHAREAVVVTCGEAIILAADHGTREVLGFIGRGVSADAVHALVVPIVQELLWGIANSPEACASESLR